jgi:hypothetical protein
MEGLHTSLGVMFVGGGICEFIHPSRRLLRAAGR